MSKATAVIGQCLAKRCNRVTFATMFCAKHEKRRKARKEAREKEKSR